MTLVTGTVQDLGYDGMEGTLWARPARFRSDGQVVYAPERKPFKITGGVVSAELAPGPAVLELQVGSHARGTFEVVIPDQADIDLADLMDAVFPWEPAQVSLFVAEREAAEQAKADAEAAAGQAVTAAGTATTAAQQTGQDRTHVDQVRTELEEAYDESQAGQALPPRLTEAALNATYADKVTVAGSLSGLDTGKLDKGAVRGLLGATYTDLGQRSGSVLLSAASGAGTVQHVTLTGNVTVSIPTMPTGTTITLMVRQDATGGRKAFWPSHVWWPGESALSSAGGAIDVVTLKSVGAAWTATVTALPANAPQVFASDDFTATDGTALHQRALPTGGVWNSPGTSINDNNLSRAGKLAATITGNAITSSQAADGMVAWTLAPQRNVRISVNYSLVKPATGHSQVRIFMGDSNTAGSIAWLRSNGEMFFETIGGASTFMAASRPLSGRLTMEVRGDTYTLFVNGVRQGAPQVIAGRQADRKVGFSTFGTSSTVDNFTVETIEAFAQTRPYAMPTGEPYIAPTYAITPTPDNTGSATHPSVVDFGPGRVWRGHRYWMAMTPYWRSETPRENPAILCSDDGYEWFVPNGLTNPVFPPLTPNYNSDTELAYDPDTDGLVMYWRETTYDVPAWATVWGSASQDGVTWTQRALMATMTGKPDAKTLLSPTVARVGPGDWRMWTREYHEPTKVQMRTAPGPLGPWSAPQGCTFTGGQNQDPWHQSVEYLDGVFYWLGQVTDNLGYYGATSTDGVNWVRGSTFAHKPATGWASDYLYRPCMQPHENGTHWRLWHGAHGPVDDWRIGFTQVPRSLWPAPPV